jgi:tyrosyl-tRNA synthetase
MHIGQGLIISRKLQDFRACGFDVIVFLADWHAYINDKLGGDIGKIRTCGKYIEDCFRAMGIGNGDPGVRFVYASELCGKLDYWEKVLRIAKSSSVARIKRSMTIMGRKEDEADADSSKLIYPSMQAADIFQMELDVAYSGIDQRKAHMLARDAAEKLGWKKPAALHTPLLTGLSGAQKADSVDAKMSKSTPDNCIFIHDGVDDIKRKIRKAYCPEGDVKGNPVIDIYKYIIFPAAGSADIERQEKHGGNLKFASFAELEAVFIDKKLHPMDLKDGAAKSLAGILKPVHEYFQKKPENFDAVRMMVMGK